VKKKNRVGYRRGRKHSGGVEKGIHFFTAGGKEEKRRVLVCVALGLGLVPRREGYA